VSNGGGRLYDAQMGGGTAFAGLGNSFCFEKIQSLKDRHHVKAAGRTGCAVFPKGEKIKKKKKRFQESPGQRAGENAL